MTKKETRYIEQKIIQLLRWSQEEEKEARAAETNEEKEHHRQEARLNDCAANTLVNLLTELEELTSHT